MGLTLRGERRVIWNEKSALIQNNSERSSYTGMLGKMKESSSNAPGDSVSNQVNFDFTKIVEGDDSLNVESQPLESETTATDSSGGGGNVNKDTNACKRADSPTKDHQCSIEPVYSPSREHKRVVFVSRSQNNLRNKNVFAKKGQWLGQHKMSSIGQQKSRKYLNLSKRKLLAFCKLPLDRNPGATRILKSLRRNEKNSPRAQSGERYQRMNRKFRHSSKKYPNSRKGITKFVKKMDLESCPGTSSGNKVIASGDMSTLPMILRNSVMTQNSDSERDDDEELADSSSRINECGANEVIDVIDGIEFLTFENEHDMVQFTRLASDESGKIDLNDVGLPPEFPEAILPKKTKDIKKIKGWQKKKFTVTQNPMLDPSTNVSDLTGGNLCPEIIVYEHNYMRRELEDKLNEKEDYTDCEDELPSLTMGSSNFPVIEKNNMREVEGALIKQDKISTWKPSKKSAFVSFSAYRSDPLSNSVKDEDSLSSSSSEDVFVNPLKDPINMGNSRHRMGKQCTANQNNLRLIPTLSPTSILMNKIRHCVVKKAKNIKVHKSVQVDLPCDEGTAPENYFKQTILEEALCEWSQGFENVWHIDEKRALFAVSAVHSYDTLQVPSTNKVSGDNYNKLLQRTKNLPCEDLYQFPSRRLLRSSTKKKTPPVRLTRSSISASKLKILDPPCISNTSNNKKSIVPLRSSTSPCKNISSSALANSRTESSSTLLEENSDKTNKAIEPSVRKNTNGFFQDSSLPKTDPSGSEILEKSVDGHNSGSSKDAPPNTRTSLTGKINRSIIARKVWCIRRLKKLKELGILDDSFNEPLPCVADLDNDDPRIYSDFNIFMLKYKNKCKENEIALEEITERQNVEPKERQGEEKNNEVSNNDLKDDSITDGNSLSSVISRRKADQDFPGNRPELENEELTVFLKPKPRPQAGILSSPVKTSVESPNYRIEINHPHELSPPKKAEVEIIKAKSPNTPGLTRKKLIRELQKLNANFVTVDSDKGDMVKDKCHNDFCRLGCICESIKTDKRQVNHCGKPECMFTCSCPSSESTSSAGKQVIGSDTVSRLQEESSRHMAKVEKDFHHTVVEAAGELVLPGRQQRERRLPKRFLDESIIPETLFHPKKAKTADLPSKATLNKPSVVKKLLLSDKGPPSKKCSVNLSKFCSTLSSIRCMYHLKVNCPCLTFSTPGKAPRNVAMKSTTQIGRKCMYYNVSSDLYPTQEHLLIQMDNKEKDIPIAVSHSSVCETPKVPSTIGVISHVQSLRCENNLTENGVLKACIAGGQSHIGKVKINSNKEIAIGKSPHDGNASDPIHKKDLHCHNILSSSVSINGQHMQCARTAGINLWVSHLPPDKKLSKTLRANITPSSISHIEESENAVHLAEGVPQIAGKLLDGSLRVEGASQQVEGNTVQVVSPVSTANPGIDCDLSSLVRQDDSMPLFKIVEVKSLPPSSFESDQIAPTMSNERIGNVKVKSSLTNLENFGRLQLNTNLPRGQTGSSFTSLESFDMWLKSNTTSCGDLEKICSKSLQPLPIGSIIVMKWPYLNKLVESHSAHLWIRQRYFSNSSSNSHIFVTQKDKPPDGVCVNFLDLESKEELCATIANLLRPARCGDTNSKCCAILICRGNFWEISGSIKLGKQKRNDIQELVSKTDFSNDINSSTPMCKSKTWKTDFQRKILPEPGSSSNKSQQHIANIFHVDKSSVSNSILPLPVETNAKGTAESMFENSDLSASVVKVGIDLDTSELSILDYFPSSIQSLKPNGNFDGDYEPEKCANSKTNDLRATGNEPLSKTKGHMSKKNKKPNDNFDQQHVGCDSKKSNKNNKKKDSSTAGNEALSQIEDCITRKYKKIKPKLVSDPMLNWERIPGTLSEAKCKQLSKASKADLQSPLTFTGSAEAKYSEGETVACSSNLMKLGIFSQSSEPPPQILQHEEVEPGVHGQQKLQSSFDSPKRREESSFPPGHSDNKNGLPCKRNFKPTTSDMETKGLSTSTIRPGNLLAGTSPPVLIIDINKLKHGPALPSNKSAPVAVRLTEVKSLSQGFDGKNTIETSENNVPTVGISSNPEVKGQLNPAVVQTSQQSSVAQEKITISQALPLKYSICKDSVVVTCPNVKLQDGSNVLPSKAIHVNIIKEVNPNSQAIKNLSPDTGIKFLELRERFSPEKSAPRLRLVGKKMATSNDEQKKKSVVIQDERCSIHQPFFRDSISPKLSAEKVDRGLNEVSLDKINEVNSGLSQSIPINSSQNKEVSALVKRNTDTSISCKKQEGVKGKPASKEEVINSGDVPKSPYKTRKDLQGSKDTMNLNAIENGQQLFIQDLPKSSPPKVDVEKNKDLLKACRNSSLTLASPALEVVNLKEAKKQINIEPKEILPKTQVFCSEDNRSPAKRRNLPKVEGEHVIKKEVGGALVGSSPDDTHGDMALESCQMGQQIPVKVAPIVSAISKDVKGKPMAALSNLKTQLSFNGEEFNRKPLKLSEKLSKCDVAEPNMEQDSSNQETKSAKEYMVSELEIMSAFKADICSANNKNAPEASKSHSSFKATDNSNSLSDVKDKDAVIQDLCHPLSSSIGTPTSNTRSTEKNSNDNLKKTLKFLESVSNKPPEDISSQSLIWISSDCALLPSMNLPKALNTQFPVEEVDASGNSTIVDKDSVSQPPLSLGDTPIFKTPVLKNNSASSLKATSQSLKKAPRSLSSCKEVGGPDTSTEENNPVGQEFQQPSLSTIDKCASETPLAKEASLEHADLPAINHLPKASKSTLPVRETAAQKSAVITEDKTLNIPFRSSKTPMPENHPPKKVVSTSASISLSSSTEIDPASCNTASLESKKSDDLPSSFVIPSSGELQSVSTENDVVWYRLDLNGQFDKLHVEETGFSTSSSRLISAVMIARTSNRTVRLTFDRSKNTEESQQFKRGIYAVPTMNGTYVKIGPYKPHEPTGVKTLKKMGNRHYKIVHNLLKIDLDTVGTDCIPSDVNEVKSKNEASELDSGELKEHESNDDNLSEVDSEESKKVTSEEVQVKKSDPSKESKTLVMLQNNADVQNTAHVQNTANTFFDNALIKEQLNCLRRIPVVSLERLPLDAEHKKYGITVDQKKLIDDLPPAKRCKVSDVNPNPCGTKRGAYDSNRSKTHDGAPLSLPITKCSSKNSDVEDSTALNADATSSKFCDNLDKMECDPEENKKINNLIHGNSHIPALPQAMEDDGLGLKITNVIGNCQFVMHNDPNQGSGEENYSVGEMKLSPEAQMSNNRDFPNNERRKLNVARKSTTANYAVMEMNNVSKERLNCSLKPEDVKRCEKSRKQVMVKPSTFLRESEIQQEEMYECGYLISCIPKMAPFPIRRCLLHSGAMVIEDPTIPGLYMMFSDIGDVTRYINQTLLKDIRLFPSDLNIEWTYSKHIPSTSSSGLVGLKQLTKDMFITCKGIFTYKNSDISFNAKQYTSLKKEDINPVNNEMTEEVEEYKAKLQNIISPKAKNNAVNLEKVVKKAVEEISSLEKQNDLLKQSSVIEKKKMMQMNEKLRALLKAHGVETMSEFNSKVTEIKFSPEEDLDQNNETDKNPKDLRPRGKCSKRRQAKKTGKSERPKGSAKTVIFQTSGTKPSDSNDGQVKENSAVRTSSDVVPVPNARVLRSSKNAKPPVVTPNTSEKIISEERVSNSSSSCAVVKTTPIKKMVPQQVNSLSPNAIRKLISSVVDSDQDAKCDGVTMNTCNSERVCSSSESGEDKTQHVSDEVKSVNANLWKKSFSQLEISKFLQESEAKDTTGPISSLKSQFLQNKLNQNQRVWNLEALGSTSDPQIKNVPSKKRKS